jgi:two-component system response regulator HydG
LTPNNRIVCISSPRGHELLSNALLLDESYRLECESRIPGSLKGDAILFLVEVRPSPRGFDPLRRLLALEPRVDVVAFSFDGAVRTAVDALRAGAANYFSLPADLEALKKQVFETIQEEDRRRQRGQAFDRQRSRYDFTRIIGSSPRLRAVLETAERVIHTRISPILIRGETGTGKELLARAIHYNSARPDEPFVEVNCSAIPDKLLESELFGHERGAFTGADRMKKGLFEVADNGTLFLDEIAELTPDLQVKLFNAIEHRTIRRVGGTRSIPVNVRIIAATNADLEAAIAEKRFRSDMYYRLSVVSLTLPPLRQRGDDILHLATHFLERFAEEYSLAPKRLSAAAARSLVSHTWPGNIRELKNVIERAAILHEGETIEDTMLEYGGQASPPSPGDGAVERIVIDVPEKILVGCTLRVAGGNKSRAARMLGVTRPTLISMIKRHHIA